MFKNTLEVIELVEAFEQCKLTKSEWTHAAHLTVGLYYCLRFPFGKAINIMRDGITWLNDSHGLPNTDNSGYHETLTVFWMITIKQFTETSKCVNLADLANQLVTTFSDTDLPLRYYSVELLFSTAARRHHVPPDLDRFYLFSNVAKLATRVGGETSFCFY